MKAIDEMTDRIPKKDHNKIVKDYENKLLRLKKSLSSLKEKNDKEIEKLKAENERKEKELDNLRQTIEKQKTCIAQLENQLNDEKNLHNDKIEEICSCAIRLLRYTELLLIDKNNTDVDTVLHLVLESEGDFLNTLNVTERKDASGAYDSSYQNIVDVCPTNDVSLDGKVAEVIRSGFWIGDKCVIPQDVIIYSTNKD